MSSIGSMVLSWPVDPIFSPFTGPISNLSYSSAAAEEYDKLDMGPVKGLNMGSTGQESTIEPIDDKD